MDPGSVLFFIRTTFSRCHQLVSTNHLTYRLCWFVKSESCLINLLIWQQTFLFASHRRSGRKEQASHETLTNAEREKGWVKMKSVEPRTHARCQLAGFKEALQSSASLSWITWACESSVPLIWISFLFFAAVNPRLCEKRARTVRNDGAKKQIHHREEVCVVYTGTLGLWLAAATGCF